MRVSALCSIGTWSTRWFTSSVTSTMSMSWSAWKSFTGRSSARFLAKKPSSRRSSPSFWTWVTNSRAQWWFVITSPLGETKEAEQLGIRRAPRRAWANQAESGWKPYVCAK